MSGALGSPFLSEVCLSTSLICIGVKSSFASINNAIIPETEGVAYDVPLPLPV